jgi:hypothetical protein
MDVFDKAKDALESVTENAGDLPEGAGDAAARGIDSATRLADSVTGGKFHDQIAGASETVEGRIDKDGSAGTKG